MTLTRPRRAIAVTRHVPAIRPSWSTGLALLLVLTSVGTRLAYLLSNEDRFNGDEAVTGVVVDRILHGHWYTFFPGQQYGGTLEQYLQAFGYLIFRLPQDRLTLRLTQLVLSAVTCAVIYACGRRMLPRPGQAALAALLFAVAPWYNVQGVMSMGFYTLSQTIAICGLYFAIRFSAEPHRPRWALLVGLACGLGYWNALITAYALLPTLIWLLPILVRRARAAVALIAGAVIGAAPLYPWMLRSHQLIPEPHKAVLISLGDRLHNLAGPVLREFLGVGITDGALQPGIPVWLLRVIEGALGVGYLALLWRRRRGLAALVTLHTTDRSALDVVLIAAPVTAALYCSSTSAAWITDPKYLLSAYPLFFLGVAAMLPTRPKPVYAALAVVAALFSASVCLRYWIHPEWQISNAPLAGRSTLPDSRSRDAQLQKAIDYLVATNEKAVYSNYWTAMPMKYLARDRLTVGTLFGRERFADVVPILRSAQRLAYVVNTLDSENQRIVHTLQQKHVGFEVHPFGPTIEVLDHIGPGGRPEQLGLLR